MIDTVSLLDVLALVFFLAVWLGYITLADRGTLGGTNMANVMSAYRLRWMRVMLKRENRMVDSSILGNLMNGTAFFASSSILLIGGLFALLGASEEAVAVLADLPFLEAPSRGLWELKVLVLVVIFVYAFFKFAWAYRLFNYCSILVGAVPLEFEDHKDEEKTAVRIARINHLAAQHFNNGLRAYFFSLATLGWFLHPILFILSSLWVASVLYRREFRSKSLKTVAE
ncbi:MAG: DUF599 family protein [Kiloniellales bacterium]|nr:DUF599 family protein [Kiloniellales bacterium]